MHKQDTDFAAVGRVTMNDFERVQRLTKLFRTGDTSAKACGYRMRLVREGLGGDEHRTRVAFAEQIGTKRAALESTENGKAHPRPDHVYRIATEYKVGPEFIYWGQWDRLPARELSALADTAAARPIE